MLKTVVANLSHPVRLHWPCARPGFTANNYPVDSLQLYPRQWPEQRFERQKLYLGASFFERRQSPKPFSDSMLVPSQMLGSLSRSLSAPLIDSTRSLGENLKCVLGCLVHSLKNRFDERRRHRLVEEVGHGIDKDESRFAPFQRMFEGGFVNGD